MVRAVLLLAENGHLDIIQYRIEGIASVPTDSLTRAAVGDHDNIIQVRT